MKKIINFFKNMFSRANVEEIEEVVEDNTCQILCHDRIISIADSSKECVVNKIDFSKYTDPIIINKNKRPNILIVDDVEDTEFLYNIDFKNIKKKKGLDIKEEYEVIKCISADAGFMAFDYARQGHKIDFAILDITLENNIKLENGDYLEIDGIDIAIELRKHNPDIQFLICTAHTMNKRNPLMESYFLKYEKYIGGDLMDNYLNKNGNRACKIYKMLTGEDYE